MPDEVRILLVEDSPTVRHYLSNIIAETPGLRVIGEASNGDEAVALVAELRPDVVSMDIKMPKVDGLEATRRIMAECPTPVVMVSGMLDTDVQLSLQALEAGALAVVGKPPDRGHPAFAEKARQLVTTLRAMSSVKVISRRVYPRAEEIETVEVPRITTAQLDKPVRWEVLAVGTSTGGPSALNRLLKEFPANFPIPIVVVQHMPHEFIPGLARWLAASSQLNVDVARNGSLLEIGSVLIAPGTAHLLVKRRGDHLETRLMREQGPHRYQPSVDVLFDSVANTCGSAAIGVVMTGMGDDGAQGLLTMRKKGGYTIAQDEASSTVFGMPRAAIEIGAAQYMEPLGNLASKIMKLI